MTRNGQKKVGRTVSLVAALLFASPVAARPSYHLVGAFNAVLPGGGRLLLGDYWMAGAQAVIETGTFTWGYMLSARTPLTLDGVPENIPNPNVSGFSAFKRKTCTYRNAHGVCLQKSETTSNSPYTGYVAQASITQEIQADLLQEIGIKYHFVNVFDSYRRAGATGHVDPTPIKDLFLAPFHGETLIDPTVFLGIFTSLAFHAYSYYHEAQVATAPLNAASNTQYALMYGLGYTTGSAAPEEMFYRGYLQNEALHVVDSPYFAVAVSTLAYVFSHDSDSYFEAGTSGLYLGALTYLNKGRLSKGIAFHFWSDFIMATHAVLSLLRNERAVGANGPQPAVNLVNFKFEF